MCNPLLLAGTALTVGGGIARGMTNRANVNAQREAEREAYVRSKAAREAEKARQEAWETEAVEGWNTATEALARAEHDTARDEAVNQFMQTVGDNPVYAPEGFMLTGQDSTGNTEVSQEIARRTAEAAQEARARIEALARLTSFDSAALDRNLALTGNANALTMINNLRRGSLGVSQSEQTIPAATVTPGDNLLADILAGTGGALSGASWSYGLT